MSQQELADKLHVTQQAVSRMEKGRAPRIEGLGRIARALGVTTGELVDGLGYTGEPIIVTGAGKAGVGDPKKKQKRG